MSAVEHQTILLPGQFAQVQLTGLKEMVEHHHANGHQVQFDASELDRIDGAAVQFLLAVAKLQAESTEDEAIVVNANNVLVNALSDMGATEYIAVVSTEPESLESTSEQ